MRAFVTGITGFAGSYLATELLDSNYDVFGTRLKGESLDRISPFKKFIAVSVLDLQDADSAHKLLRKVKPDLVFHLAAAASVGQSFENPQETLSANVMGTLNLLEALRGLTSISTVLVVSSSDIYGAVKSSDLPLKEDAPVQPLSPYGVSKAAADMLAYQYFRSLGIPIVRARAFNHTGPKQSAGFVVPDFCRQVAVIERSRSRSVIRVGNLGMERDISDVRDIVRGYRLLAERGVPGEVYHLCSGKSIGIGDLLAKVVGMATREVEVVSDCRLVRPTETPRLLGDYSKARKAVGFKPLHRLDDTISDTLEYWRKEVRRIKN
jgi:GDP-4-dehydro-6-deoxy-D-mannose reductase